MTVRNKEQGEGLSFLHGMLKFIKKSPSPYHASKNLCKILEKHGFRRLSETSDWNISDDDRCFVTRNGTSVIAFRGGKKAMREHGMRLVGAHIDSPCLKLNPNPFNFRQGYWMANVEVYGSPLLRTWFDRDLSIAGRIIGQGLSQSKLVNCKAPVAVIPSIAIHLDREANKRQEINAQFHINPLLLNHMGHAEVGSQEMLSNLLFATQEETFDILGFDLRLYDVNPPRLIGAGINGQPALDSQSNFENQYISSARIDNLLSCYAGVQALVNAEDDKFCMLICSDHEEVGSVSDAGAQGNFLMQVLARIDGLDARVTRQSVLISADGAHGLHPNYPDKHDEQHRPKLNQGPVIKVNSNQRYATSDETESIIRRLCAQLQIPVQVFVSRNDMPCGSTIGPLAAAEVGIRTVDVGVAQFAMHSIRELAGCQDTVDFAKLLKGFYNSELGSLID